MKYQLSPIPADARQLRELESVRNPCVKPSDLDLLKIVVFSDYRVQDISLLLNFMTGLRPSPNLILYAGDDVERFHSKSKNFFEQLAATATHGLCAVIGNDDGETEDQSGHRR